MERSKGISKALEVGSSLANWSNQKTARDSENPGLVGGKRLTPGKPDQITHERQIHSNAKNSWNPHTFLKRETSPSAARHSVVVAAAAVAVVLVVWKFCCCCRCLVLLFIQSFV